MHTSSHSQVPGEAFRQAFWQSINRSIIIIIKKKHSVPPIPINNRVCLENIIWLIWVRYFYLSVPHNFPPKIYSLIEWHVLLFSFFFFWSYILCPWTSMKHDPSCYHLHSSSSKQSFPVVFRTTCSTKRPNITLWRVFPHRHEQIAWTQRIITSCLFRNRSSWMLCTSHTVLESHQTNLRVREREVEWRVYSLCLSSLSPFLYDPTCL